jgi:DNA-binding CsgD family transcriptional regulator
MARFVVLERAEAATARSIAAEFGGPLVDGWDGPSPPGAVRVGVVADSSSAAQAVLAAVRGCDLVVLGVGERAVIDQLCDDLRRLGELDHRVEPPEPAVELTGDERALLQHLVSGASLGAAAKALHVSRRTADRRLASARRALGAGSTSEALVLARRLGIADSGATMGRSGPA